MIWVPIGLAVVILVIYIAQRVVFHYIERNDPKPGEIWCICDKWSTTPEEVRLVEILSVERESVRYRFNDGTEKEQSLFGFHTMMVFNTGKKK